MKINISDVAGAAIVDSTNDMTADNTVYFLKLTNDDNEIIGYDIYYKEKNKTLSTLIGKTSLIGDSDISNNNKSITGLLGNTALDGSKTITDIIGSSPLQSGQTITKLLGNTGIGESKTVTQKISEMDSLINTNTSNIRSLNEKVGNSPLPPNKTITDIIGNEDLGDGKTVTSAINELYDKTENLSTAYKYKGSVDKLTDLPNSDKVASIHLTKSQSEDQSIGYALPSIPVNTSVIRIKGKYGTNVSGNLVIEFLKGGEQSEIVATKNISFSSDGYTDKDITCDFDIGSCKTMRIANADNDTKSFRLDRIWYVSGNVQDIGTVIDFDYKNTKNKGYEWCSGGCLIVFKNSKVDVYSDNTPIEIGDVWNTTSTDDNYAWTGVEWDKLGGTIDLSGYQTKEDLGLGTIDKTVIGAINELNSNKQNKDSYLTDYLRHFFNLQRTGKVYTVRMPLWSTSHNAECEKLDDNAGLICEPSTTTIAGRDDYQEIPLFKTYDVNASIKNGKIIISAIKGDDGFNSQYNDTFVLGMSYYHKTWTEDGYIYYSRTDKPRGGYVLCKEAEYTRDFCLYAKYQAGWQPQATGMLGSYSGVRPERNMSYNKNVTQGKNRGDGYAFGFACDIQYLQNTFLLKYANRNFNNVLGGCFNYNYQHFAKVAENNVKRIILDNTQASHFVVGSNVMVGEIGTQAITSRGDVKSRNIVDGATISSIVDYSEGYKAINLTCNTPFNTTTTTQISTAYWNSGYSDKVLGRDGCPCADRTEITTMIYPSVLQGIELCVGGHEVLGNAFMSITQSGTTFHNKVYVCNEAKRLTSDVNTAKSTYEISIQEHALSDKNAYINGVYIDVGKGINITTYSGLDGSGSTVGYCDTYNNEKATGITTGEYEFCMFGLFWSQGQGGIYGVFGANTLATATWHLISRLSLSGFKG